ncbi:MAG TPA: hypothetical protein VGO76_08780 [Luteibacter sp.]|jgi:hypothetical protein|nr:hypothetical protein [Luteibacter sp.]
MNKKATLRVFSLSLRVSHPSMKLDQVLARIPIKPERAWSVGDPRLSPRTGVDMGGVQVRTYAVMPFVADPASIDASIAKVLRSDCLADEDFLREFTGSGGSLALSIGIEAPRKLEFFLSPAMSAELGSKHLNIWISAHSR